MHHLLSAAANRLLISEPVAAAGFAVVFRITKSITVKSMSHLNLSLWHFLLLYTRKASDRRLLYSLPETANLFNLIYLFMAIQRKFILLL